MTNAVDQPNRRRRIALVLVSALAIGAVASACNLGRTSGAGPVVTESRPTQPFTKVVVSHGIGVSIQIGPAAPLQVQAQQSLLPIIETTVDNGTLRIRGKSEFTASSMPQVVIVTPTLDVISLSGGSQGRVDGLASDRFGIELSGGASLTGSGSAGTVALDGSGGSTASLQALAAKTVVLELSGGTIAALNATEQVLGDVSGGARATVAGGAQLSVDASGGGEVTHD